jgi:sarcosine oxidase subunit alpha
VLNTETGRIVDDGTVVRLAEDSYLLTTSSGGVDQVYEAFLLWIADRDLDVEVVNVSGALGAVALSGPRARDVLARVADMDVSGESLEYLGARECAVAGAPALLMRIGFLGELGFEIHVPSTAVEHVWDAILAAGEDLGIVPLGVEALKALRLEKGHIIVGIDTDSESTMLETSVDRMIAWDKDDFVGRDALVRMRARGADRRLVGFVAAELPREGTSVLVGDAIGGRVTSARLSAVSGRVIGLAYVPAGIAHDGARFEMDMGEGRRAPATVHLAPFYDPDGERMRA